MSSTLHLPNDVATLQELLLAQQAEREALLVERDRQLAARDAQIVQLQHEVARLRRAQFGPRSERGRPEAAGQARFIFPELLEAAQRVADATGATGTIEVLVAGHRRRRRGRRAEFPGHLPVVRTTFDLPEEQRLCCGQPMAPIGHETSRQLERIEVTLVHEIARTKYACRVCAEKLRVAPGPARVIEKGLLGSGFLAHVITERFARHMPYYRLEQKYADEGLSLSRSVLCRSALRCAELLTPIVEQMKSEVLAAPLIQTDDTPITIQARAAGGRATGHAWVYRDLEGRIVYDFTESRSRDGPLAFLVNYRGYVQADAYGGYDVLFVGGLRIEIACWAHVRRKYVDAQATDPVLAAAVLARIRTLYAIEKAAKEAALDVAQTTRLRQEQARPVLTELRAWLQTARSQVLDKSPMAQAIGYTLSLWEALLRYVDDGSIPIDNNGAERALRPLAVGRKNWLFVGHEEAGKKGAVLMSLVATCREIGLDPRMYLHDVLERIATCSDVRLLTPHGWKEHFLPQVEARRDGLLAALAARPA
jgi:transposase